MSTAPQRNSLLLVLSNFSWLVLGDIVCRLIALGAVAFYVRELPPETFGYLGFSLAVMSYLGLGVMAGLDITGMREVARSPEITASYAANIIAVRLVLASGAYAFLVACVVWFPMAPLLKWVLCVDALSLLPVAAAPTWALQGLQKMHLLAGARVLQAVIAAGLIFLLVRGPGDVLLVCASNVISAVAACIWMAVALRRLVGPLPVLLDTAMAWSLLKRSVPFAVLMITYQVYSQSGVLILGWLRPPAELGFYSAAQRLTMGLLQRAGILLTTAFVPALAFAYAHAPAEFSRYFRTYLMLACAGAGAILVVFGLYPAFVLHFCFGAVYEAAASPLRFLAAAIAISLATAPYAASLMATRYERELMWQAIASAAACLALNAALIPQYGGAGAGLAALGSVLVGAALSIWFYHRRLRAPAPVVLAAEP